MCEVRLVDCARKFNSGKASYKKGQLPKSVTGSWNICGAEYRQDQLDSVERW
jgi:hypothetical protein